MRRPAQEAGRLSALTLALNSGRAEGPSRMRWFRAKRSPSGYAALFALADIAFVGGSLVPRGGHNIIEPALHGVPIVVGNHTENFRDIVGLFQGRDAVRVVGAAELPLVFMELLENDVDRAALGRHALETIRSQTGATARTAQALETLLAENSAHPGAPTPVAQARAARKE